MPSTNAFRTFQTVTNYEQALARHAQWVRWTRALLCPCINEKTRQPDPSCTVCKGRGKIYKTPGVQSILQESARHDAYGKVYPINTPVVGTPTITRQGAQLALASTQPADGSYILIDPPYPDGWQKVYANYDFSPVISVLAENSEVYETNVLRTIASRFSERGKTFEGSVQDVSRVFNASKAESYTVVQFFKEYIYLASMGTWVSGDTLEVDYDYVKPFKFVLLGVSEKIRWEQAWVLPQADATLITPYWARVGPNDLITSLAAERYGSMIINPRTRLGNDIISNEFDVSKITSLVNYAGVEYTNGTDYELFGRNEIKWNITKPQENYSVEYLSHPTYVALTNMHTLRTAENKSFVNRVSLMRYDRTSEVVNF